MSRQWGVQVARKAAAVRKPCTIHQSHAALLYVAITAALLSFQLSAQKKHPMLGPGAELEGCKCF